MFRKNDQKLKNRLQVSKFTEDQTIVSSNEGKMWLRSNEREKRNPNYKKVSLMVNCANHAGATSYSEKSICVNMAHAGCASAKADGGTAVNVGDRGTAYCEFASDSCALNTADRGKAFAFGKNGTAMTTGNVSRAETAYGIAAGFGPCSKAMGGPGSWIVLAEFRFDMEGNWYPVDIQARQVDGKEILPYQYYTLRGGEFIPVQE